MPTLLETYYDMYCDDKICIENWIMIREAYAD